MRDDTLWTDGIADSMIIDIVIEVTVVVDVVPAMGAHDGLRESTISTRKFIVSICLRVAAGTGKV